MVLLLTGKLQKPGKLSKVPAILEPLLGNAGLGIPALSSSFYLEVIEAVPVDVVMGAGPRSLTRTLVLACIRSRGQYTAEKAPEDVRFATSLRPISRSVIRTG